ncbi:hypothetical protein A2368_02450 [Candidatus Collierbacteria bacterium RIFOXYB1_FULL_49_13]|uniref:Phage holin family protein n=1 Tax=Candidatus Collierbacteria bacterium RIFOXYB1_FULL_49_13 TaxID=1817728 RepID=A0A1F5FBA9_9BACT|nr:MAG: hypothetical protein A2368_02450 [Candidatus Collierbacteria bacterium RIFOXYB1_FULL_49_13]
MFKQLLINAVAFLVISYLVPGVRISSLETLLVVAVVYGLVNMLLKPLLILLTLPINIMTLGLFTFVINAIILLLVARIVPGFMIAGWWTALIAAVLMAIVNMFLGQLK